MELIGYTDRWHARPGDHVEVKVTTSLPEVRWELVRLVHGDRNPAGPGFLTEPVPAAGSGTFPGRAQETRVGSFGVVEGVGDLDGPITVELRFLPTLLGEGRTQTHLSTLAPDGATGFALQISERDGLRAVAGGGASLELGDPCVERCWHHATLVLDPSAGQMALTAQVHPDVHGAPGPWRVEQIDGPPLRTAGTTVTFAGRAGDDWALDLFNGKLEGPRILGPDQQILADWDFAREMDSASIADAGPRGHRGRLWNGPARAVTGRAFTGEVLDVRAAPEQYAAIHFHDDDLTDARWETDVFVALPADLPSATYAVRLSAGEEVDHVPLFVRPAAGAERAEVALLMPTLTYQAYANEQLWRGFDRDEPWITDHPIHMDPSDLHLEAHPELGSSLYDRHRDGTGVCYSSTRRPVVDLRPDHRSWLPDAPRHLAADLYIGHWLEHERVRYDVLTDHDLDADPTLLDGYRVVVTGSHPEYTTSAMRDGFERLLGTGGRMMYLGANGFYWVTTLRDDVAEVRRGHAGTRSWEGWPGEDHHSQTGEPGGLWRHRGLAPNALVGIGFTAQGWDSRAPGYRRTAQSSDPRAAWIFDGVGEDEVIGDFGLVMGGASGDELDRADRALGTPPHALVVATSTGHSDLYQLVVEDVPTTLPGLSGTQNPLVRSDMTFLETPSGGAVFSVGSIAWAGSLSHDGYRNNVARITGNVLRRFTGEPRGHG